MKNGDKSAFPTEMEVHTAFGSTKRTEIGLSKREHFAGLAMQGLISSFTEKASNGRCGTEIKETIKCAIDYADELLKQLENK